MFGLKVPTGADVIAEVRFTLTRGGPFVAWDGSPEATDSDVTGDLLGSRNVVAYLWAAVRYVENTRDALVSHRAKGGVAGPAVTLAIAKRAGANAVVVAEEVLHRVEALEPKLIPDGVMVTVTRDYGETANEKANELLFHLGLATLSIVALVGFAIGWREALVVAIVIPVTILLTLFAARIMGYTPAEAVGRTSAELGTWGAPGSRAQMIAARA